MAARCFSALGLLLWPWFRDPQLCQLAANHRCAPYFWGRVAMTTRWWQPTEQGSAPQKRPLLGTAILGRGGILSGTAAPPSANVIRDLHFNWTLNLVIHHHSETDRDRQTCRYRAAMATTTAAGFFCALYVTP